MRNVDLRELALKKVKITGNVIGKFGTPAGGNNNPLLM